jgi:hypothetical protein
LNPRKLPFWLLGCIALTTVLSIYSIVQRYRVESANNTVAIAADYDTLEALAAGQGITIDVALARLKSEGLNTLVLSEDTIGGLASVGRLSFESSVWRDPEAGERTQLSSLVFVDPTQRSRVERGLRIRFQELAGRLTSRTDRLNLPPVSTDLVRSTAIGLNPEQVAISRKAGMLIVGRFNNPSGLSGKGVRETLAWGREMGMNIYLPMGDQVLGRKDAIQSAIDELQNDNILYAAPEFAKLGGEENVLQAMPSGVVRLHAAQVPELDKMSFVDAVDRYTKAARERNMRVLLLRPLSISADQPLDAFGSFVAEVSNQIRNQGLMVGPPTTFEAPKLPKFWPMLIAVFALPIVWYAASQFVTSKSVRSIGAVLLGLVALAAYTKLGTEAAAFIISLGLPVAGFAFLEQFRPKSILIGFLVVSGMSLLGGVCIAAMMNGLTYYIQADEFRGVKLSVFFPVVLIGAFFFMRLVDWKATLRSPITWGTATLGLIILLVLGLVVARSGNDTGASASSTELIFRNILDRVLYVRPRTKEFLVGHPLLIAGIGMLGVYWKRLERDGDAEQTKLFAGWTTLVLMVSAVGQTSIVNTLSHLHIPVLLSLSRILIGLVIGCMIGLALWAIVQRFVLVQEK